MNNGFYTALGTPVDEKGKLIEKSFKKHIAMQIDAKAAGLLCMGSMGNMVTIKDSEYVNVAKVCANEVNSKLPLMVGVMDCSIGRVLDRIDSLNGLNIDGVVATMPYYSSTSPDLGVNFYKGIADESKFPLYMYDLPSVTQSPVNEAMVNELSKHDNIVGIKTANINLISSLKRNGINSDFDILYSGLDTFDVAIKAGIKKNLDGMFCATPINAKKMYMAMENGDYDTVSECLNNILLLRNTYVKHGVLNAFSYSMELIGCPGIYHQDYAPSINDEAKQDVLNCMKKINEL